MTRKKEISEFKASIITIFEYSFTLSFLAMHHPTRKLLVAAIAALFPIEVLALDITSDDLDPYDFYLEITEGSFIPDLDLNYTGTDAVYPTMVFADLISELLDSDTTISITATGGPGLIAVEADSSTLSGYAFNLSVSHADATSDTHGLYLYDSDITDLTSLNIDLVASSSVSSALAITYGADTVLNFPVSISAKNQNGDLANAIYLYDTNLTFNGTTSIVGNISGGADSSVTLNLSEGSSFTGDIENLLPASVTLQSGATWQPITADYLTSASRAFSFTWGEGGVLDLTDINRALTMTDVTVEDGALMTVALTDNTPSGLLLTVTAVPDDGSSARIYVDVTDDRSAFSEVILFENTQGYAITLEGITQSVEDDFFTYDKTPVIGRPSGGEEGYALTGFNVVKTGMTPLTSDISSIALSSGYLHEKHFMRHFSLLSDIARVDLGQTATVAATYSEDRWRAETHQKLKTRAVDFTYGTAIDLKMFQKTRADISLFAGKTKHRYARGSADTDALGVAASVNFVTNAGTHYAAFVSASKTTSKGHVATTDASHRVKLDTRAFAAGLYVGFPYAVTDTFSIEPYASGIAYKMHFDRSHSGDLSYAFKNHDRSLATFGVKGSWENASHALKITGALAWIHRFDSTSKASGVSSTATAAWDLEKISESFGKASLGLTWQASDKLSVNLTGATYKSRTVKPIFEAGASLRYVF